jgi:hypothetical protein
MSTAFVGQALHFNGKKWKFIPLPEPGGTSSGNFNELDGVSCNSSSDCWAVGTYTNGAGAGLNLMLHFTGRKWTSVSVPQPAGSSSGDDNLLRGIICTSASDCWAVGFAGSGSVALNEVLHLTGRKWRSVTVPQPGGTSSGNVNELDGISCISASHCWAVGNYKNSVGGQSNEALRFGGKKWTSVTVPQPGGLSSVVRNELHGVSCTTASSCLAVGVDPVAAPHDEALRFEGKGWSKTAPVSPSFVDSLAGVSCASPSDCWAVGFYFGANSLDQQVELNQVQRWNGRAWALFSTPQPGGTAMNDQNALHSVACSSASDCWAVGTVLNSSADQLNEALHWNGKAWSDG